MKQFIKVACVLAILGLCSCSYVGLGESDDTPANTYEQEVQTNDETTVETTAETTTIETSTEETTIDEPIADIPSDVEVVEAPEEETTVVEETQEVQETEPEVVLSTEHEFAWVECEVLGVKFKHYQCIYCGKWYTDIRDTPCVEH